MRVLFDHQTFIGAAHGGISRYFSEIIRRLPSPDDDLEVTLALSHLRDQHLQSLDPETLRVSRPHVMFAGFKTWYRGTVGPHPRLRNVLFRVRRFLGGADENSQATRFARSVIRSERFDVFHPTYYDPYFLDDLGGRPFVLTVFDMIHELLGAQFPPLARESVSRWKARLVKRAARIIAISETTRLDLVRIHGVPEDRITVIPLGPVLTPLSCRCPDFEALRVPDRFILFVGRRSLYKNFEFFVRAAAAALVTLNTGIVCVGGGPPSQDELSLLRELGIEGSVRFFPDASDRVMTNLFHEALAYVSPSLYEGFGLPTLDAFACGCPALLSSISAHREVAGAAAEYFDPESESSVDDALSRVLREPGLREDLVRRGNARVSAFSWRSAANRTADVYRTVVGRSQTDRGCRRSNALD